MITIKRMLALVVMTNAALISFITSTAYASEQSFDDDNGDVSQMIRGGAGLIQTPTARMAKEGSFTLNYNDIDQYRFWSASLQLFPWMESTVRYTDVRTQLYSQDPSFSGDQTLKDKGIDVKFRLIKESYYLPDVSFGLTDIGGTGFFSSEFLNFSKNLGPFDIHLGVGTGYLGAGGNITNPLCEIKDSFCERPGGFGGRGGKIDYNEFFKGPASVFGGIEYRTPIEGLTLKLEYDGNDYVNDRAGTLEQDSEWNVGAVYKYNNWDFNVSYQRGNTFGFGVSYNFNMHTVKQHKFDRPPRELNNAKPAESIETINRDRLYADLVNEGSFIINATHTGEDEMTFYGTQLGYRDHDEATQRVGRILASELPDSIKTYKLVDTLANIPLLETKIDAQEFKVAANYQRLETDIQSAYVRQNPTQSTVDNYHPKDYSGAFFNMESFWIQTFGNPEDFYLYQGGAYLNGGYQFNPNFSVRGGLKVTVLENFDKFNFLVDSETSHLPRVRTQVREYVTRSKVTMENAYLHWFDKIAEDTYAQVYGGYLETMFGGVGTEVLYRPVDSSLAFGVDLNYVQQRDFNNETGFFDYKAFTGHASVYWTPEFLPDMQLTVNAGQFLAKDKGVNIDVAKRFDSGIIVGAYAAFTNVSAEEYGEGSFTKGFYISIPFDLFSLAPAKGRGKIPWIPIGRDGGQMLQRPVKLKNLTEARAPFYD
ncbi:YjbH domain-containing protein [Aliiglaciecola sp. 2_MG-2023]|uniref:YjbH domain-containing protein n=1 Tax=unclassified Aliiglaciecola TaxID=2593648 RepID=UPI0026E1F235|nr:MULTISPECIES: YjbH domain-containing protein [unclassified Aliiglaciecola]MDO6710820.1 YjbH domain-containing protein [Aliiglaciecola sp. 2_MG-2023]MDO6751772.1 YjbH domain-containing protein [Aliiglaciecola sp. 1_MG-2023]